MNRQSVGAWALSLLRPDVTGVVFAVPAGWTQFDTGRIRRGLEKVMAGGGPEFT